MSLNGKSLDWLVAAVFKVPCIGIEVSMNLYGDATKVGMVENLVHFRRMSTLKLQ